MSGTETETAARQGWMGLLARAPGRAVDVRLGGGGAFPVQHRVRVLNRGLGLSQLPFESW